MIPEYIDRRCANCGYYTVAECLAGVTVAALGLFGKAAVHQAPQPCDSCVYHKTDAELIADYVALKRFRLRIGIEVAP